MATVQEQNFGKSDYAEMIQEYEEVKLVVSYKVKTRPTEASERCALAGIYDLALVDDSVMLLKPGTLKPIFTWPYRFIRKYGIKDDDDFYFEAGSKCDSGPGLFTFTGKHGDAQKIYKTIQSNMAELKIKEKQATNTEKMEMKTSAEKPQLPIPVESFALSTQHTRDDRQPRDPTAIYAVVNKQPHLPLRSPPTSQHPSASDKPPKQTSSSSSPSSQKPAGSSTPQKVTPMSPKITTLISQFENSDDKTQEKEASNIKEKGQEVTRTVKKHQYENVDWK